MKVKEILVIDETGRTAEQALAEELGPNEAWRDWGGYIHFPTKDKEQEKEIDKYLPDDVYCHPTLEQVKYKSPRYQKVRIVWEDEQPAKNEHNPLLTTLGQVKGNIENAYKHLQAEDHLRTAMLTGGIAPENMSIVEQQGQQAKHSALRAIAEAMSIINHAENKHNNAGTMEGESGQEA